MKWHPFELHTHTPHSDGTHTLLEMCKQAKELGLSGIALTDHNTVSGLIDSDEVTKETGVAIIPGMEWTTFYGHMLTLGAPYCEWRDLGPADIGKGIERVHQKGGIVGIAHPYSMGSPICTGCHWEYEITDWNQIDYIEVWHETMPSLRNHNAQAFRLWTDLLNQGFRIAATAGRDWHRSDNDKNLAAYTYLGIEDSEPLSALSVVDAISRGRLCISMGPLLLFKILSDQRAYGIGEVIGRTGEERKRALTINVSLQQANIPERQWIATEAHSVIIESNQGELCRGPLSGEDFQFSETIEADNLLWVRARLYGLQEGLLATLAFTNPIYLESH
ncbi:CehA/McbA family metallohydrolase [Paenibacillus pinihumi]|uniref:CehA/McbA family metallohydrolase n=1 Tax=Paenibacillus pinihumi TaxID=669462 RepID=UPI000419607D|nr:CehA/McbA family metallohydrolase [Paenibacillus pinihumi]